MDDHSASKQKASNPLRDVRDVDPSTLPHWWASLARTHTHTLSHTHSFVSPILFPSAVLFTDPPTRTHIREHVRAHIRTDRRVGTEEGGS